MLKGLKTANKIKSHFAILDVLKKDRKVLEKHFNSNQDIEGSALPIPVTITGFIADQYGRDDGESIEFRIDVKDVTVTEKAVERSDDVAKELQVGWMYQNEFGDFFNIVGINDDSEFPFYSHSGFSYTALGKYRAFGTDTLDLILSTGRPIVPQSQGKPIEPPHIAEPLEPAPQVADWIVKAYKNKTVIKNKIDNDCIIMDIVNQQVFTRYFIEHSKTWYTSCVDANGKGSKYNTEQTLIPPTKKKVEFLVYAAVNKKDQSDVTFYAKKKEIGRAHV